LNVLPRDFSEACFFSASSVASTICDSSVSVSNPGVSVFCSSSANLISSISSKSGLNFLAELPLVKKKKSFQKNKLQVLTTQILFFLPKKLK